VPALLNDSEVAARLKGLKGWKHEGSFIAKTFEFKEFMDGIVFINAVAKIAEKEEHHPDISIRYTTIKLSIQTDSEGGVTEWDFGLATKIEGYLAKARRAHAGSR
jgi:4a-hydroxytetrahydrobiopterin dehydratase